MFLLFLYFPLSAYAQGECPVECAQNWQPNEVVTMPAPGFPGCEILVVYHERRCATSTQVGRFVEILHWQINGGDCTALLSNIFPNFPNGPYNANQAVLDAIFEEIQGAVSLHIFMNMYNNLSTSTQSLFHCPNYNAAGTVTFQNFTCQSTCITRRVGDVTKIRFTNIPCSNEGCCSTFKEHCFNPTTGLVETQETVTTEGNPPCEGSLPTCNISSGFEFVQQLDCGGECD